MTPEPQTPPVFDTLKRLEDPRWLESVLWRSGRLEPSVSVIAVSVEQLGSGRGVGAQIQRIEALDDSGQRHRLVGKTPIAGDLRPLADASGIYERELAFYERLAGSCPLQTPSVLFAGLTTDAPDFAILLEDLDEQADLQPFDQVDGMSLTDAHALIPSLAGFHRWSRELDPAQKGAFPSLRDIIATVAPMVPLGWAKYLTVVDAAVSGQVAAIAERFPEFVDLIPGDTHELIHGDVRADNLFRRDGAFLFIDFQMVCLATGIVDVAYFASQSIAGPLTADDHRSVLAAYLDALGQPEAAIDEDTWRTYRMAVGLYLFTPAVAMLTWDTAGERGRSMALTLMQRWLDAAEALDLGVVFRA